MPPREIIHTQGIPVSIITNKEVTEYISLTDIARFKESSDPNDVIKNWLRNRNTIEYLTLWESINNDTFKSDVANSLILDSGANSFVLSPKKWIANTNALGIVSKSGRYGGTYAHSDIAFEFASWISPEFKLYLIKDYQNLKASDSNKLSENWNLNRTLAKLNHHVHTDAIKDSMPITLSKNQIKFQYTNEVDRLNMALFGMRAKDWREANPDLSGNIRDYASATQLLVLANLETHNSEMIREKVPNEERTKKLNDIAKRHMETFLSNQNKIKKLK